MGIFAAGIFLRVWSCCVVIISYCSGIFMFVGCGHVLYTVIFSRDAISLSPLPKLSHLLNRSCNRGKNGYSCIISKILNIIKEMVHTLFCLFAQDKGMPTRFEMGLLDCSFIMTLHLHTSLLPLYTFFSCYYLVAYLFSLYFLFTSIILYT